MKQAISVVLIFLATCAARAQSDSIYLHNGSKIACTVLKTTETSVSFHYENETAEQTYGKYAVWKVVFGKSGRVQKMSKKIRLDADDGWENVEIVENPDELAGLNNAGEVEFNMGIFVINTPQGEENKAKRTLKKQAAKKGCQFILMKPQGMSSFAPTLRKNLKSQTATAYSY